MQDGEATPGVYMTVGEAAKKMEVTVRTLQYYDREGLLTPSAQSAGGRRLYTHKDVIKLHQILSLKSLGFSLEEIKHHLLPLDTPAEVAEVLADQVSAIRARLEGLNRSLAELETLRAEVLQMQSVDFKKYADIITNLQMKNEFYWMIKHFDDDTLDFFRKRFDLESGQTMLKSMTGLIKEAVALQQEGALPEGETGQAFAQAFWDMLLAFTGGDLSMLPKLMAIREADGPDPTWKRTWAQANAFLEPALDAYFKKQGIEPFEAAQCKGDSAEEGGAYEG